MVEKVSNAAGRLLCVRTENVSSYGRGMSPDNTAPARLTPMAELLPWPALCRGFEPELASASLRMIADLIDRHGKKLLNLLKGHDGSIGAGMLCRCWAVAIGLRHEW
jgi:hypothetical protein